MKIKAFFLFSIFFFNIMPLRASETRTFWGNIGTSVAQVAAISMTIYLIDRVIVRNLFKLGSSRAQKKDLLTLADYGGAIPQQVQYFIETYKDPNFMRLGAQRQKGILLYGPPGTGKTLLGKVIAGEIGSAFYYVSAAEIETMYVGSGAERLRSIFDQALRQARKTKRASVIFIDEIDVIAAKEGKAVHDSSRQTLTQLLTLMDGFEKDTPIAFVAATNRIDVIDAAVLREGRFDEKICIDLPDETTRLGIIRVIAQGYVLAADVDLQDIAVRTEGFTGAELQNVFNRAALDATFNNEDAVYQCYIDQSLEQNPKYFSGTLMHRGFGM